jgi:hypothetical protein
MMTVANPLEPAQTALLTLSVVFVEPGRQINKQLNTTHNKNKHTNMPLPKNHPNTRRNILEVGSWDDPFTSNLFKLKSDTCFHRLRSSGFTFVAPLPT